MKTKLWANQITPEGSVPLDKPTLGAVLKEILDYIVLFFMKFTELLEKELKG